MHNTVANGIDFINGADYTMLTIGQTRKHFADRSVMLQDFTDFRHIRFAGRFVGQNGRIHSDTFYQTFCQYGFIRHVVQLIF
ncbi:hypothetical protein D3C80_1887480 [compost metagenome]